MPDVEKTVNIKINVDDAELSKIDTAEGKVRDMVDKLKEVKGGTFDIKPGGGGATPSGKTPDRDPSFQMLRIINFTLNKILNQMRGDYIGAKRQTASGTTTPGAREREKENVSRVEIARLRNLVETAQLSSTEQLTKYTRDIVQNAGREPFQAQQKRMSGYVSDMRTQQQEMVESWEEMFGPMSEKVGEKFSDMMNRVIAKRMDEMTNMYVAAAKKNKDASNTSVDAANDWRKGIRGMITGALIDFHLLRVIGQSSHVVAASMDMLSKTMGLLLDVILLPFLPAIGILARGIATFATLLMSTNPIITAFKTALSVLIAAITTIVLIGAFKGGATGGMFGAVRGGFGALQHGVGKILGRASGGPLAFGQTAIVGENGPEMLLPTSGGFHVVPNNQLRMLADGTDLTSVISEGIVGGGLGYLTGKMFGGDLGGYLGAGVGAGLGAGGVMGGLPQAIGQAASFVYGQPVVQGVLATMASLAGSINAVIAPLAPILGGAGGIALGAVLGRGYGGGSETTAKVGNVTNKNISAMSYGVQNAVGKAGQSTNTILTMILLRLNGCFNICPESIARITTGLSGAGAPTNLIRIGVGTGAAVAAGALVGTAAGEKASEVTKEPTVLKEAFTKIAQESGNAAKNANSLAETLSKWNKTGTSEGLSLPTKTPSGQTVYITKPDLKDKGISPAWLDASVWEKTEPPKPDIFTGLMAGGSAAAAFLSAHAMGALGGEGALDTIVNTLKGTQESGGALKTVSQIQGDKLAEAAAKAKFGEVNLNANAVKIIDVTGETPKVINTAETGVTGFGGALVGTLAGIPGNLLARFQQGGQLPRLETGMEVAASPQFNKGGYTVKENTNNEYNYNITIHSTAQNGDQLYNEFIRRMKQDGARIS